MTQHRNGQLPQSALAPITRAANGEQAYLRADAALAFNAMNAESERRFGVTLRATSARCAYRPLVDQDYFWSGSPNNPNRTWDGNLAAEPGNSNHGLATTVDFATRRMRAIVDQIGAKYGFSKAWSDAANEWWHIKFDPAHVTAAGRAAIAAFADPLRDYPPIERRLIREYDDLRAHRRKPVRRLVIKRWMRKRRKAIWHAAKASGWIKFNRRARYKSLLARSK